MNIPNLLTFFRILLIPIFMMFFFSGMENSLMYSIITFLIAGFTDVLDGYIARKYKLITDWGTVLDPLADKLMLVTVLSCLVIKNYIPSWVLVIILIKEGFMIIAAALLYTKGNIIPSNIFGKASTLCFYLAIFVVGIKPKSSSIFIYIAVVSALVAFINYLMIGFKKFKTKKS